jgi:hypothetical protein
VERPFKCVLPGVGMINVGGIMVVAGGGLIGGTCAGSGGLACGAGIFGGAHLIAGGLGLGYAGFNYFRNQFVPCLTHHP